MIFCVFLIFTILYMYVFFIKMISSSSFFTSDRHLSRLLIYRFCEYSTLSSLPFLFIDVNVFLSITHLIFDRILCYPIETSPAHLLKGQARPGRRPERCIVTHHFLLFFSILLHFLNILTLLTLSRSRLGAAIGV